MKKFTLLFVSCLTLISAAAFADVGEPESESPITVIVPKNATVLSAADGTEIHQVPGDAALAIEAIKAIGSKDLKWFRKGKSIDAITKIAESYYGPTVVKCLKK